MAILEELLKPLSFQEFSENYLFKMPYAAPFNAKRFENLISWPLLSEIFSSQHKDCWLPRHGFLPDDQQLSTGQLSLEQARKNYDSGRTVLIRHAEKAHPKLTAIAEDFHQLLKDPIDIQVYCTPAGEEGFDWHYDVEEVFVIQSQGEKEFRLRKNTVNPWPSRWNMGKNLHYEKEMPSPEIRCHLKAGDWLYIPSGWWHKARAVTDSTHLSVGVMARTPLDFLQSLLPELAQNPYWRQRLPIQQGADHARDMLQNLSVSLGNVLKNENRFLQFANRMENMNVFSLKLGMNAEVNQAELMQLLKSNNAEVIQTSDGLCIKSDKSRDELNQIISSKAGSSVSIQPFDGEAPEMPADVRAFVESARVAKHDNLM